MSATPAASADRYGPWNPGIVSPMPREVWPLATIFRPEYVATPLRDAIELADLTGLAPTEIVAWRPERLALHELLVRVTADFSVPDGPRIEDLGIHFRELTTALWRRTSSRGWREIVAAYDAERAAIAQDVSQALAGCSAGRAATVPAPRAAGLARLVRARRRAAATGRDTAEREAAQIAAWEAARASAPRRASARCTARSRASADRSLVRHGRIWGDARCSRGCAPTSRATTRAARRSAA